MKKLFVIAIILFSSAPAWSQVKYWIFFRDKKYSNFNPYTFFDPKAIERRIRTGIPLYDSTDFPVNENYLNQVGAIADSMGNASRWLNATGVWATKEEISRIAKLPFVLSIKPMHASGAPLSYNDKSNAEATANQLKKAHAQLDAMQGFKFKLKGVTGKGIRIAVLDVGFVNVDKHEAFKYLRDKNKIIATNDFIKKGRSVYAFGSHGAAVLSCIAGVYHDSVAMGLAPDAEFLLARTELERAERKSEEDNWIAAAEWADQNGAEIISSSLGYTYQRYFYNDMNGTSEVSRGANMAARKGILVINAAGNEGVDRWKYIDAPADADSVLAVGGLDPETGYHINFGSFGPTADKRLKPEIIAPAQACVAMPKNYGVEFGTSFATPLISGFAACVWQMNRSKTNMGIYKLLEESANMYPYYDYAHGYGTPQAGFFTDAVEDRPLPSFSIDTTSGDEGQRITIAIADRYFDKNADRKKNSDESDLLRKPYLFYHIADANGVIKKYYVIKVKDRQVANIPLDALKGNVLMIYFDGYTQSYNF